MDTTPWGDEISELEEAVAALEEEERCPEDREKLQETIYRPLRIMKDVSSRFLDRSIPASRERLAGLFSHISSAVGDLLSFADGQVQAGLAQVRSASVELALETGSDSLPAVSGELREAQRMILAGLGRARETFFSASSFEELENRHGALQLAESELEEGLARLESALALVEVPQLASAGRHPVAPEIPVALEALSGAVEALGRNLEDGRPAHLEDALTQIEQARVLVQRALGTRDGERS